MNLRDEIILAPAKHILEIVSLAYGDDSRIFTQKVREGRIAEEKAVAAYFIKRNLTFLSHNDIKTVLGWDVHSTISHAVRRVYDRLEMDKYFKKFLNELENQIVTSLKD